MKFPTNTTGFIFALIYIVICIWAIATQGLFGESFIALLLGLPWSLVFTFFEYGGVEGVLLYALVLGPLVLNAAILYWLGSLISKKRPGHIQV